MWMATYKVISDKTEILKSNSLHPFHCSFGEFWAETDTKTEKIIFSYMTDIFHIMYCVDCSSSDIWVWIIPQYKLTQNETLLQSYSSPFVTTSDSEVPSKNVQCQIMPACKNLDLLCDDLKNILDAAPSHASQTLFSVLSEFSTIKAEIF